MQNIGIPFNKPYLSGKETDYIHEAVLSGKISGNGIFTKRCQNFFQETYGFLKCLMTTSCTDALEMAAILIDIQPGDEVIIPSYTFVSTANAFVLRGAKIIFIDSRTDHPGLDEDQIERLITPKTKAIVPVHYAGVACDMRKIMDIANRYGLFVIEDAAQAIDSYYCDDQGNRRPLGSIGHLAAFSFHETKNIISGEGGLLIINDPQFVERAEIIWEKGTNRSAFFRGEVDKYGWVDVGSSFLPSEIISAFLWAQLENLKLIQNRRLTLWNYYNSLLSKWNDRSSVRLPFIPTYATNNAHAYCLICDTAEKRVKLIDGLRKSGILAVFHYQSLHKSAFYSHRHDGRELTNADFYTDVLVRLPLFFELELEQIDEIVEIIRNV